ncbi:MAG: pyruvate, water dikinase regulatory protein [Candidatus Competibacterales bacterium]|nr:pyruvate, water dikinase regulatory protein [Candidatus Competibacterales bacterium]
MSTRRTAFFVSDSTCITAQHLGRALLTQFEFLDFHQQSLRFVNTAERAQQAAQRIDQVATRDGLKPLVFATLIDPELRHTVRSAQCVYFDLFETFVERMEEELGTSSVATLGHSHGMHDRDHYFERMDAINFTLNHDDGSAVTQLERAEIILVGISRTGKTPTCLYLSLHYGVRAANFPITEDELDELSLPPVLAPHRDRLFGLTTDPVRLQHIRNERLPNSRYASMRQCEYETRQSEALYRKLGIPYLVTTMVSIEEIAATIVDKAGLERNRVARLGPPAH